jgi:hypothetical protein
MAMTDWREQAALALDAMADCILAALGELDVVEILTEARGNERLAHEVRALAASLRSERADMQAEARALRPPLDGFPLALTGGPTVRRLPRPTATDTEEATP